MKRDMTWWHRLTAEERSELWWLEHDDKLSGSMGGGGYLPDDCGECSHCSAPSLGGGLCTYCLNRLITLHDKADCRESRRDGKATP